MSGYVLNLAILGEGIALFSVVILYTSWDCNIMRDSSVLVKGDVPILGVVLYTFLCSWLEPCIVS